MSETEERKPAGWKGIIGFLLLVLVIGGAAWGIIRFENTQSVKDAEEAMAGSSATQAQCYTPTEKMPFTSGNPRTDLALTMVIKDNQDTPELKEFLKNYRATGKIDTESALWGPAEKKAQETSDIPVRAYLEMDLDGNLSVKEEDDTKYVPIVVEPGAGTEAQWDVAGIAKVTDGTAEGASQQIIIAVSEDAVVIPVENGENSDTQEYGLVSVSPIC